MITLILLLLFFMIVAIFKSSLSLLIDFVNNIEFSFISLIVPGIKKDKLDISYDLL